MAAILQDRAQRNQIKPTLCVPETSGRTRLTVAVRVVAEGATALAFCCIILALTLQLWRADWRVPFVYGQDGLLSLMFVSSVIENPWYWHNDRLGAPFGMDVYDFPMSDNLHFLVIKLIGLFSHNPALVCNVYFLLTFALTTLISLVVLRRLAIGFGPALVASLLFTFLPYRLFRSEGHLFLSSYYLVPLMVMVLLELYRNPAWFLNREHDGVFFWRRHMNRRLCAAVAICLATSSAGVYYAFFSCFLCFIAGSAAAVGRRRVGPAWLAAFFIFVLTLGVLMNLAPSVIYQWRHGPNPAVAVRPFIESEIYGLKISQLLLPISGHRWGWLAQLKAEYNRLAGCNETDFAALGIVGSVGFVLLGWRVLVARPASPPAVIDALARLNVAAVLLATVGGLGTTFALLCTAKIRAYNRISVFIAFFALTAVALLLDMLRKRWQFSDKMRRSATGFLGVVLVIGILDQSSPLHVPPFKALKMQYAWDDEFVRRIEAQLPPQALVFQLPYMSFPEPELVGRMSTYDPLRGYLHSRKLGWSYGAMHGRWGDRWYQTVAEQSPSQLIDTLVWAGFQGVWIDREGCADGAASLHQKLCALVVTGVQVSQDNRFFFFDLSDLCVRRREEKSPDEQRRRRDAALCPVFVEWATGYYSREQSLNDVWRWCGPEGAVVLENQLPYSRRVRVEMLAATGHAIDSDLCVLTADGSHIQPINSTGQRVTLTMQIHPGRNNVRFSCQAPRLSAPSDPRVLVFKIINFHVFDTE